MDSGEVKRVPSIALPMVSSISEKYFVTLESNSVEDFRNTTDFQGNYDERCVEVHEKKIWEMSQRLVPDIIFIREKERKHFTLAVTK